MGTWGTGIKENDTSFDVYETFFEKYNEGLEVSKITEHIYNHFEDSLNDIEDKYNVLFPLSLCLWEVCSLNRLLYNQVKTIIENEDDIKVWQELGAKNDDIPKRRRALETLLQKISENKEKPKNRKKPPVKIDTKYNAGCCLSFQYPNNKYGGVIVIDSEFYKNNGNMRLAITDIEMNSIPTFGDFENAKLIDFEWETVWGQALRYTAFSKDEYNYTGRIHTHSFDYSNSKSRELYFNKCSEVFNIVGQFPVFTQILLGTTWVDNDNITKMLYYYYERKNNLSNENLKELCIPLTTSANGSKK